MYKMFGAEYEAPESKLYAELEGEQVGIDLMTTKNAEKLSCGCPLDWAVDGVDGWFMNGDLYTSMYRTRR